MKDYYKILDIDRDASSEDIRRQYKKLAIKYHPDKNPYTEEKFKEISEAYQILIDETAKNLYDNNFDFQYVLDRLVHPKVLFNDIFINIFKDSDNVKNMFKLVHGDQDKFIDDLMSFKIYNIFDDIKDNIRNQITGQKKPNTKLLNVICIICKYILIKQNNLNFNNENDRRRV
jgi:DnaJ-class molecular chaperone